MASAIFEKLEDGISKQLEGLLDRSKKLQAFLNTNVYRKYQVMQLDRWMTENGSQGSRWDSLSAQYAKRKKIIYGGGPKHKWVGGAPNPWRAAGTWPTYPGAGNVMLVGTGELVSSTIGPGLTGSPYKNDSKYHRKLVGEDFIEISTTIPYGQHVADRRPFMEFGDESMDEIYAMIEQYVLEEIGDAQ